MNILCTFEYLAFGSKGPMLIANEESAFCLALVKIRFTFIYWISV